MSGGFREVGSDPCRGTFWGLAPANLKFDSGEAAKFKLHSNDISLKAIL